MIDKKGRLFGLVSVIDLLVVAGLGMAVVFGILQVGGSGGIGLFATPQDVYITVTTRVPTSVNHTALEGFTARRVQLGDPVRVAAGNVGWGNVTETLIEPYIDYHHNQQGEMVASEMVGWYTLTLTTRAQGFEHENGVWINGHIFLIGQTQVLQVGDTNLFVHVIDIQMEEV